MCLQEVQEDHYEKQIKPSLEALGNSPCWSLTVLYSVVPILFCLLSLFLVNRAVALPIEI